MKQRKTPIGDGDQDMDDLESEDEGEEESHEEGEDGSGQESDEDDEGGIAVEDVEDDQGDLDTEILDLLKKVQKICRKYKKSNVLNDELQEKVKAAFGKELQLKLDCKTRWHTVLKMLEQFYKLRYGI